MNSWLQKNRDINFLTLRFPDNREREFRDYYYHNSISTTRLSLLLVAFLYAIFSFLDIMIGDENLMFFIYIRLYFVTPMLLIVFALSFTKGFINYWQQALFISYILASIGIIIMISLLPSSSLYSNGLMLIFLAGSVLVRLRFLMSSIAGWITIIAFNIISLYFYDVDSFIVITSDFFFIGAILIGMFAAYHSELFDRQNFDLIRQVDIKNKKINEQNSSLENTIKNRTKLLINKNEELQNEISTRIKTQQELLTAKNKAEQSDRLKSAFLANMSHEIRTPLNAIIGFSNLLPSIDDKEKIKEFTDIIVNSGNHLLVLINEIIDLSRIEAGILDIQMKTFSLNSLLDDIHNLFIVDTNIVTKKLDFIINKGKDDEHSIITTDQTRLKQIIINLVNNSTKYTEKGSVEIGYSINNDMLYFYVKDTGIGISEEQQASIFERFMQITLNNTPDIEGNGLGLAITKTYLKIMGGNIKLRSKLGVGSEFSFNLPINHLNK